MTSPQPIKINLDAPVRAGAFSNVKVVQTATTSPHLVYNFHLEPEIWFYTSKFHELGIRCYDGKKYGSGPLFLLIIDAADDISEKIKHVENLLFEKIRLQLPKTFGLKKLTLLRDNERYGQTLPLKLVMYGKKKTTLMSGSDNATFGDTMDQQQCFLEIEYKNEEVGRQLGMERNEDAIYALSNVLECFDLERLTVQVGFKLSYGFVLRNGNQMSTPATLITLRVADVLEGMTLDNIHPKTLKEGIRRIPFTSWIHAPPSMGEGTSSSKSTRAVSFHHQAGPSSAIAVKSRPMLSRKRKRPQYALEDEEEEELIESFHELNQEQSGFGQNEVVAGIGQNQEVAGSGHVEEYEDNMMMGQTQALYQL